MAITSNTYPTIEGHFTGPDGRTYYTQFSVANGQFPAPNGCIYAAYNAEIADELTNGDCILLTPDQLTDSKYLESREKIFVMAEYGYTKDGQLPTIGQSGNELAFKRQLVARTNN